MNAARHVDLNLTIHDGGVRCRHCGATVGDSPSDPTTHVLRNERPSTSAGPGVHADPASFVDRAVVLRQTFCPGCLVLLSTEIVPADEPSYRSWTLA